jgi:hypothetical protein
MSEHPVLYQEQKFKELVSKGKPLTEEELAELVWSAVRMQGDRIVDLRYYERDINEKIRTGSNDIRVNVSKELTAFFNGVELYRDIVMPKVRSLKTKAGSAESKPPVIPQEESTKDGLLAHFSKGRGVG